MKRLLAKVLAATVITTTITNIGVSSNIYANTMQRNNQESTDENKKWNLVWEDNFIFFNSYACCRTNDGSRNNQIISWRNDRNVEGFKRNKINI